MFKDKILFIVNSVYQLFTSIHLKTSAEKDREADIILTDVTESLKDCIPRLSDTGLFTRILYARTKELNRKYAVGKQEEISEGFDHIDSILRWTCSDGLGMYQRIYFSNFDTFTRMLACKYYDTPCEFICYEDGFSTYVIDFLREGRAAVNSHPKGRLLKEKLSHVLLYEPALAMRGDNIKNLPLPKISRDDHKLRDLLNHVFSYESPVSHRPFIFLEQSFRAEGIRCNDLELMEECRKALKSGCFMVKPHPRNRGHIPFLTGIADKYFSGTPWELFLLNEDPADTAVITVCSNAALTGRLVFGLDMDTVMLYRLFDGKVLWKEDAVLKRYLMKFHRQFAGKNYHVPKTIYELRNLLGYLGGRHDGI